MWDSMFEWMTKSFSTGVKLQKAAYDAWAQSLELNQKMMAGMWGQPPAEIALGQNDPRFKDKAWHENAGASFARQSYLVASKWMEDAAEAMDVLDPKGRAAVRFWTRQAADALSPANNPFTNPVVLQETMRTGGANLFKGMQNLNRDLAAGRLTQVPEDAFQVGVDLACTPGKVVYRSPLMEIIQYSPATEHVREIPVLVVPPWINKYYVMDMAPDNSLYRYLVGAGFTVFTISWKNPDESILGLEFDDYVQQGPLEALQVVREITGAEKVNLVGYCLGGIAAQVSLGVLAARGDAEQVNTATFFTTHQDYSCLGDIGVFIDEDWLRVVDWMMQASGGYLDGRNMAATFNMLRANDLLWRYVVSNYLLGQDPPAFALLYWNNDGTRVPAKLHATLLRELFLHNKLQQPGALEVLGEKIDLAKVTTPTYAVAAQGDHIVPWQGAYKIRELMGGPVRFILTEGGHIAGVVNPPTPEKKRGYYTSDAEGMAPADDWLLGATKILDSWWTDWAPWLEGQSGDLVEPPRMGSEAHPAVTDAPGLYVMEK